jgi:octaprenyl-diphosphate synthase
MAEWLVAMRPGGGRIDRDRRQAAGKRVRRIAIRRPLILLWRFSLPTGKLAGPRTRRRDWFGWCFLSKFQGAIVAQSKQMDIDATRTLIREDMLSVDALIRKRLHSEVALINRVSDYIIAGGGKRLRPALVILSARAFGYSGDQHYNLAAIVEFIHTATLLHDDVVDESQMRRGRETANSLWGNETAVLVGDFLYSRSFEMMVDTGSMRVMEILSHATNTIAEGEVLQLLNCNDPETTEERYLEVIHCKTARLFEAAARLGAVISGANEVQESAMANYGMYLGTAFQLVDDLLDYSADADQFGKNLGDDLAEGKPTLPLIYAMRNGTPEQGRLIRRAIEEGSRENIEPVLAAIESTGAIQYTSHLAREEAGRAVASLEKLKPSVYRDALDALAGFSVARSY